MRGVLYGAEPHVVLLDIGSNDLSSTRCHPEALAREVDRLTGRILASGVAGVIVLPVIRRTKCGLRRKNSAPAMALYNAKVARYNYEVRRLLAGDPRRVAWEHASQLSPGEDGVHVEEDELSKYVESLRRATAYGANQFFKVRMSFQKSGWSLLSHVTRELYVTRHCL